MSHPAAQLNNQLEPALVENELAELRPKSQEHPDQEEDSLIGKDHQEEPAAPKLQEEKPDQDQVIDPFHELVHNNDVIPIVAVLDKLDLTTVVEGKPLLSRLCTLQIPLDKLLKDRKIQFTTDEDNRTALHDAIVADDVSAVYWCLKNNIGNQRDNFGNTPILQAIKLGRRICFLLCLHYEYMDSQAAHFCAIYNRAWQLKILHRLGMDVLWVRDSQHFTPLERAVENYSYDVAEFLARLSGDVSMADLAGRTDSKGILRLIKRTLYQNGKMYNYVIPLLCIVFNILFVYYASTLPIFELFQSELTLCLGVITILYICLSLFSWKCDSDDNVRPRPDFLALLQAPQFPPNIQLCPYCLVGQNPKQQHCLRCNTCVQKYHYHEFVCVHGSNEIFWFGIELLWFWLTFSMHDLFYDSLKVANLKILTYSSSFFFGNAAIIQELVTSQQYLLLFVFLYLKIFMLYQFCCLFQWVYMLVLNRTYQEANHSERYVKLFRIGKTHDGSYKSQEIRLMEKGLIRGCFMGIRNVIAYFFR